MRGRILWLLVGTLAVVGLVWSMPWLALSSGEVDAPKVEASKDQPEQDPTKAEAEQAATNEQPEQETTKDQPEQETTKDQPEDEKALQDTPPSKEEGVSNNLPPPSSPPAQFSPTMVEEVPQNFLSPNDDWYYDDPNYWYYEPEPDDWYYEPNYWDY